MGGYHPDSFSDYARRLVRPSPSPGREEKRLKPAFDTARDEIVELIEESGLTDWRIARDSGLAAKTLGNWRTGRTRRPQHMSLRLALAALGKRFVIVDLE
jgi:hypothetical protein